MTQGICCDDAVVPKISQGEMGKPMRRGENAKCSIGFFVTENSRRRWVERGRLGLARGVVMPVRVTPDAVSAVLIMRSSFEWITRPHAHPPCGAALGILDAHSRHESSLTPSWCSRRTGGRCCLVAFGSCRLPSLTVAAAVRWMVRLRQSRR